MTTAWYLLRWHISILMEHITTHAQTTSLPLCRERMDFMGNTHQETPTCIHCKLSHLYITLADTMQLLLMAVETKVLGHRHHAL
jgi:hypothetical protein